jgi:anti-sigma factor RsiW
MNHLSNSELHAFLQQGLPADELLKLDDHLAVCPDCRTALEREAGGEGRIAALAARFVDTPVHLNYGDLLRLAEGQTASAEASRHVTSCRACAAEVAELRQFAAELAARPRSMRKDSIAPPSRVVPWRINPTWYGLAAAMILLAVGIGYWRMAGSSHPAVDTVASLRNGDEQLTVDRNGEFHGASDVTGDLRNQMKATMTTGRLEVSLPASFSRLHTETMLGAPEKAASFRVLTPVSCVAIGDRPAFAWEAMAGATSYRVMIYDVGYQKIAESPTLHEAKWQPSTALPRGTTYTWTVTAGGPAGSVREPAPPQPEAAFRVMKADEAALLQQEARRYAGDPLLLAVLYARAGAMPEAQAQLDRLAEENPGSRLVDELRASLAQAPSPTKTNAAQ